VAFKAWYNTRSAPARIDLELPAHGTDNNLVLAVPRHTDGGTIETPITPVSVGCRVNSHFWNS